MLSSSDENSAVSLQRTYSEAAKNSGASLACEIKNIAGLLLGVIGERQVICAHRGPEEADADERRPS